MMDEAGPSTAGDDRLTRSALLHQSLQLDGFGALGYRRKAWLRLLDLDHLESKLSDFSTRQQRHDSSAATLSDRDQPATIEPAEHDIPLDNEGWQITPSLPLDTSNSTSNGKDSNDWEVATTKKERRRRRQEEGIKHDGQDGITSRSETNTSATSSSGMSRTTTITTNTTRSSSSAESRDASLAGFAKVDRPTAPEHDQGEARKNGIQSEEGEIDRVTLKEQRKTRKRQKKAQHRHGNSSQQGGLTASVVHVEKDQEGEVEQATRSEKPLPNLSHATTSSDPDRHKDEEQVALDVRRSFIPLGDTPLRKVRRDELSAVIIGVLRQHPALHYYQGYHDIISTLLEVLVPRNATSTRTPGSVDKETIDAVIEVSSRVSLHLLRDSMTSNMTPTLGHLKVLRNLLRQMDGSLAQQVERAGPLPYFALPWLLTLFAHELDSTLAPCIFDFVLPRGPIALLALMVALLQQTQQEVEAPDAAEMHHILATLPKHVSRSTLPDLLQQADRVYEKTRKYVRPSPSDDATVVEEVMGRKSVLFTWSELPVRDESDQASRESWSAYDRDAEAILAGDIADIVVNALPSPPASEADDSIDEADEHIKGDKALVARTWWYKGHHAGAHDRLPLHTTSTLLAFAGAFGAMGAAAALVLLYGAGEGASILTRTGGGLGSAFPVGLRAAEPLRFLFRNILPS